MKYFKKIFELDPKEVEEFIVDEVKAQMKRNADGKDISDKLKDYDIEIHWFPTLSEFRADIEPKLETKDYKHFYFKGSKDLTAGEYFHLASEHYHYYFAEIYGFMTGKPVCYSTLGTGIRSRDGYQFIINKEHVTIIYDLVKHEYFIKNWDEENDKEILRPVSDDTKEIIEKCIEEMRG